MWIILAVDIEYILDIGGRDVVISGHGLLRYVTDWTWAGESGYYLGSGCRDQV